MGRLFIGLTLLCLAVQAAAAIVWFHQSYLRRNRLQASFLVSHLRAYRAYTRNVKRGAEEPTRKAALFLAQNTGLLASYRLALAALLGDCLLRSVITAGLLTYLLTIPLPDYYSIFSQVVSALFNIGPVSYQAFLVINAVFVILYALVGDFFSNWRSANQKRLTECLDGYHEFLTGFSEAALIEYADGSTAGEAGDTEPEPAPPGRRAAFCAQLLISGLFKIAGKCFTYGYLYFVFVRLLNWEYLYMDSPSVIQSGVSWRDFFNPAVTFYMVMLPIAFIADRLAFPKTKEHRTVFAAAADRLRERYTGTQNITVAAELKPLEERILRMCGQLRIRAVEVRVEDSRTDMAGSYENEQEPPVVFLSRHCLEKYRAHPQADSVFLFMLGHELAHIHGGDTYGTNEQLMTLCSFIAYLLNFAAIVRTASMLFPLLLNTAFLALFLSPLAIANSDARCWSQVKELRADRIALRVSGVRPDILEIIQGDFESSRPTDRRRRTRASSGFWGRLFSRIFRSYELEYDLHPLWSTRIRELKRNGARRWTILDSIGYMERYGWRLFIKREWRMQP